MDMQYVNSKQTILIANLYKSIMTLKHTRHASCTFRGNKFYKLDYKFVYFQPPPPHIKINVSEELTVERGNVLFEQILLK